MPRQAKPIFYKDSRRNETNATGWWCLNVTENGRRSRIRLAQGKGSTKAAMKRFHAIQVARAAGEPARTRPALSGSVLAIVEVFLTHAEVNVAPKTYRGYSDFLNDFLASCPDGMLVGELKVLHVTDWLDSHDTWGPSTKSGAIGAVRRCFKWAFEQGRIPAYPFPGMKAPQKQIRETIINEAEFAKILAATQGDDLKDLLRFLWYSGVRPQEARLIEPRHCDLANKRIILPPSQAKGKKKYRVIYLADKALEIVQRLLKKRTKGRLFRPAGREAWTSNAIRQRFKRMEKKLGVRYCQYNFRHSFATHALTEGVDGVTVGVLMGHADPSMVGKVYQHLAKAPEFMQAAANKARG